jgi:hypothetical protein
MTDAAEHLRLTGQVQLAAVLPSAHVAGLNAYATRAAREGWLHHDRHSDRFTANDCAAGKAYHTLLVPLMSRIAGRSLIPSYSFLASYRPGAHLPTHTDRAACDYTLTMHLGQDNDQPDDWPLTVQADFDSRSHRSYRLRPGEALLLRGTRLGHGRPARTGPGLYNQLLWHFVEAPG